MEEISEEISEEQEICLGVLTATRVVKKNRNSALKKCIRVYDPAHVSTVKEIRLFCEGEKSFYFDEDESLIRDEKEQKPAGKDSDGDKESIFKRIQLVFSGVVVAAFVFAAYKFSSGVNGWKAAGCPIQMKVDNHISNFSIWSWNSKKKT